jgi:hypothetical protein
MNAGHVDSCMTAEEKHRRHSRFATRCAATRYGGFSPYAVMQVMHFMHNRAELRDADAPNQPREASLRELPINLTADHASTV